METNENPLKYSFVAKKSNPVLAESKKKTNKIVGTIMLVFAVIFGALIVLCAMSNNPSLWVCLLFGGFAAVCVGYAIYLFATAKSTRNDDNKVMEYVFLEYTISFNQHNLIKNTKQNLTNCLYNNYKNKQYISKLSEFDNRFEIQVYTGTYNGLPQHQMFLLPKDVVGEEKMEEFKEFLKQKMGSNYITR